MKMATNCFSRETAQKIDRKTQILSIITQLPMVQNCGVNRIPIPLFFKCCFLIAFAMIFVFISAGCEQQQTYTTAVYLYSPPNLRSDVPVLVYEPSRGHFGGKIDSNIDKVFIWKDGTLVWCMIPEGERYGTQWYRATIPVEKIEAALQEIALNFAQYPVENRPRELNIIFRIDASYAPSIGVYSAQHYERSYLSVDYKLFKFYKENRKVFQSGNGEAILKTIKAVGDEFPQDKINENGHYVGLHPAWKFDYKGLVLHYWAKLPHAVWPENYDSIYSDTEILKCAALYTADMEHLLLMEKRILDLLPSHEGLKAKKLNTVTRYVHVEQQVKEGNKEFSYSHISKRKADTIWKKMHEEHSRE